MVKMKNKIYDRKQINFSVLKTLKTKFVTFSEGISSGCLWPKHKHEGISFFTFVFFSDPEIIVALHQSKMEILCPFYIALVIPFSVIWMCQKYFTSTKPAQQSVKLLLS